MPDEQEEIKVDTRRWAYGPNGQSQIFDYPEQIPEGWQDHPSKVVSDDSNDGLAEPEVVTGNGAASDHTLSGDANINRGNPQGEPTGTTQGGETGQPTDSTFVLKPVNEVDKNWIMQHLNTRKVPHNPKWDKKKLYDILRDAVSPSQG